jgi:hypothetical protein
MSKQKMTLQQIQAFLPQLMGQWNVLREQTSALMRLVGPESVAAEIEAETARQKDAQNQVLADTLDDGVANGWLVLQPPDAAVLGGEVVVFDVGGSRGTVVPATIPQGHVFTGATVGQSIKFEGTDATVLAHYSYDRALQTTKQQEVAQEREAASSAVASGPLDGGTTDPEPGGQ